MISTRARMWELVPRRTIWSRRIGEIPLMLRFSDSLALLPGNWRIRSPSSNSFCLCMIPKCLASKMTEGCRISRQLEHIQIAMQLCQRVGEDYMNMRLIAVLSHFQNWFSGPQCLFFLEVLACSILARSLNYCHCRIWYLHWGVLRWRAWQALVLASQRSYEFCYFPPNAGREDAVVWPQESTLQRQQQNPCSHPAA